MKLIFQGLVCKSSQPILGDAVASYHLIGQWVHLKALSPKEQGTTTYSVLLGGKGIFGVQHPPLVTILPRRRVSQGGLTAVCVP